MAGAAAPVAPPAASPPDGVVLQEELRQGFASALQRLDQDLIDDHQRSNDAALVMRVLRDDPVTGIRQLPVAAQRALSMLHGDASPKALVAVLEKDPALSQALLRQVNSAYYNPSGKRIVSLTDAINRMGRVGVQGVIFEQSVSGMVSRPGGELDAMVEQVWNHMVRTAPIARQLARAFEIRPDEGFLVGLLHDVGKLVVFDRITEVRGAQRRLLSLDRGIVGKMLRLLHEPLGGLVVQQWGVEPDAARAIASHHRDPIPPIRDRLCELTYLAERIELAHARKETPDLDALWSAGALTGDRAAAGSALAAATG